MTVQQMIDELEGYKDKSLQIEFTIGRSEEKRYTRARFFKSMTIGDLLSRKPSDGLANARIELYP